jgi:hypothetical protein
VESRFDSRCGQEICLFSTAFVPTLGPTQPLMLCVLEAFSQEIEWPGYETKSLITSSADVKNAVSYASIPPYHLMV